MRFRKWDLVIVGGGAGGAVLALELAKKGFKIAIIDQKGAPNFLPRGEILQPNGLKTLDQLGLLSEILGSDVHLNKAVHFHQVSGQHLCTIDYSKLPAPYSYSLIILPEVVQKILLQAVAASANVEIFWGTTFKRLLRDGERVAGVEAERRGKAFLFRAPMVVGADGIESCVRSAFQIKHEVHSYADGYVTMVIDRPPGFQDNSYYYLGKGVIFGAFPVSSKRMYLFYLIPDKKLEEIQEKGIDHFKEEICSLHPEIRSSFSEPLQEISSWDKTMFMRCFRVVCHRWVVNGGALLGDAVHAMNPHVAQGRNAAMEDGKALSNVVQWCFEQGNFSQDALSRYEVARRTRVDTLQRLGDEMTLLWNSGLLPIAWLRDRIFRAVYQERHLHDKLLRMVAGLEVAPLDFSDRWKALCPWKMSR